MKKIVFLMAMLSASFMAFAQDVEKPAPASQELSDIRLAAQLAKYGYQNNSASALIEAASILSEIETQPFVSEKITENNPLKGEDITPQQKAGEPRGAYTPASLLADARTLAKGDPALLSMIARVSQMQPAPSRGAVGGPRYGYYRLNAGCYTDFVCKFKKGVAATVVASGDGDTDLDLYVYDENGNLIATDDDYSDDCIVSWYPRWTGNYVIRIINRGYVWNAFEIATN